MAKLYFYFSAMNAGKTTTLLQSDHNYRERGMRTILFTAKIDNRTKIGTISSRIGLKRDALAFDEQLNFIEHIKNDVKKNGPLHCVLVDEAQFLSPKQVRQLGYIADHTNIPVLTYGIRSDFQGKLFPGSQELLTLAEEMCEIKTICICSRKATMNLRMDESGKAISSGDQIAIGGNDRYISLCRRCFFEKHNCEDAYEL